MLRRSSSRRGPDPRGLSPGRRRSSCRGTCAGGRRIRRPRRTRHGPGPDGAGRGNRELEDRVAEAVERLVERHRGRGQIGDLVEERLERRLRGAVRLPASRPNSDNERPRSLGELPQRIARLLRVRRHFEDALSELPRPAGRGQPACAPFRAAGQVRLGRVLVPAREPLGPLEVADEAVERREVTPPAPADPRFAECARHREGARRLALGGREAAESQARDTRASRSAVGRESVGDPLEERQRGLAGTGCRSPRPRPRMCREPRARARAPR